MPSKKITILSDTASLSVLAIGGFLAATAPLLASGWQARPDGGEVATTAVQLASLTTLSLGPIGAAVVGVALLFAGVGALIRRPHTLRWLAISLGALVVVSLGSGPVWLDVGIVLLCAAGWASQFFPSRELASD